MSRGLRWLSLLAVFAVVWLAAAPAIDVSALTAGPVPNGVGTTHAAPASAYDSSASPAHATSRHLSSNAVLSGAIRAGSWTSREDSARTRDFGVAADTAATGWKVGDPIENLTKAGNSPSWSTVRARYWKNAADDALEGEYSESNLARMQAGKPPLHDELGVPMELNHITPRWQGGAHTLDNLEPLWPWEHAAVDPFRFYTGPTP